MKPSLHVYKIGGKVIDNPVLLAPFLANFAEDSHAKILVHGGGKRASEMSERLGVVPNLVDGRRITDQDSLEVVTMVYAGLLNKQLVARLQSIGCNAVGLSGADGNAIRSDIRQHPSIDFGFVGDVAEVNHPFFQQLLEQGTIPVCCAITHNGKGLLLNTNADTVAQRIATAMSAQYEVSLSYIFERPGVLRNPNDNHSVIEEITAESYAKYKADGTVSEGMLPKLDNAFKALTLGIGTVWVGKTKITKASSNS